MATANDYTFEAVTPTIVGAVATEPEHVRDRFGNLLPVQPGEYVVQLDDGSLTVMTRLAVLGYE